jgi:nucleoid-associated protein YgaU
MSSRYDDKTPRINNSDGYQQVFEDRGVKFIKHYSTPELKHAHFKQIAELSHYHHVWKLGDKLYKLASIHYNSPKLWWLIAWYNKTPTESHIKPGQIIRIPFPLNKVKSILRIK